MRATSVARRGSYTATRTGPRTSQIPANRTVGRSALGPGGQEGADVAPAAGPESSAGWRKPPTTKNTGADLEHPREHLQRHGIRPPGRWCCRRRPSSRDDGGDQPVPGVTTARDARMARRGRRRGHAGPSGCRRTRSPRPSASGRSTGEPRSASREVGQLPCLVHPRTSWVCTVGHDLGEVAHPTGPRRGGRRTQPVHATPVGGRSSARGRACLPVREWRSGGRRAALGWRTRASRRPGHGHRPITAHRLVGLRCSSRAWRSGVHQAELVALLDQDLTRHVAGRSGQRRWRW